MEFKFHFFFLVLFSLWIPPCLSDLNHFIISPQATDPSIDQWLASHQIYSPDDPLELSPFLHLHLVEPYSSPEDNQLILQEGAQIGLRSIGLSYPNSFSLRDICDEQSDCYGASRHEILTGKNVSPKVDVSTANSIENRLIQLLKFLNSTDADGGWTSYLKDEGNSSFSINWSLIILSGHLEGSAQAAYMGIHHSFARIVLFSSIEDHVKTSTAVPWEMQDHKTPAGRYFGFIHTREWNCDLSKSIWQTLGLSKFGPFAGYAEEKDTAFSHQICTSDNPEFGFEFHRSTVVDRYTPKNYKGIPIYASIWRRLLGAGNCELDHSCQGNATCLSNGTCYFGPFPTGESPQCDCRPCLPDNYDFIVDAFMVAFIFLNLLDITFMIYWLLKGFTKMLATTLGTICIFGNAFFCYFGANLLEYGWGPNDAGTACRWEKWDIILAIIISGLGWSLLKMMVTSILTTFFLRFERIKRVRHVYEKLAQ